MRRYRFVPRARGASPEYVARWRDQHGAALDLRVQRETVLAYLEGLLAEARHDGESYNRLVKRMGRAGHPVLSKARLLRAYQALVAAGEIEADERAPARLLLKPVRTASGVAPVTVLTKPYACPGKCIFCPTDARMPKSYLSDEPGGMRALQLDFDPYVQTARRIEAMQTIGHSAEKVELLILGGTWSAYPQAYQEWFVRRCFDAMNGQEASSLEEAHHLNERARLRNVGLVIETRPDHVTVEELRRLRWLGVTRVQLGAQSLDDRVQDLNKRGHSLDDLRRSMYLLRSAGFKITLHWMPNLLGATAASDLADSLRLWRDPTLRPDELKIYPTALLAGTELHDHYLRGEYQPYDLDTLRTLLADVMQAVPRYCRLNRVMRDIPKPDIVAGVTNSNLRQIAEEQLRKAGTPCQCIRCREVRRESIDLSAVSILVERYDTDHSQELFISANTAEDRLAGFLRLSLPTEKPSLPELEGLAMIRQLQVYGPMEAIAQRGERHAQHRGLGARLIAAARREAAAAGYTRWAVIAAVGTRDYYRRFGFDVEGLYMTGEV